MRLKSAGSLILALDLAGLKNGVEAGQDEDAAGDISREMVADVTRDGLSEDQPDQRHEGFEEAERDPHPDPGSGVDPADADPDRARKIAQAHGHANEQEADHSGHRRNYMSSIRVGTVPLILIKNS